MALFFLAIVVAGLAVLALQRVSRGTTAPLPPPRRRLLTALRALRYETTGALLPGAESSLSESGAGVAQSLDLICVLSCSELGTDLSTSGGTLRMYSNATDLRTDSGRGEGLEFVSFYIPDTKKAVLFGKLATTTAAAISNVDTTGVLGTSLVTFTGTPFDDAQLQVSCEAAFTVGTAGGLIAYSKDGGVSWSGNIRVGTATSYAIPDTGVTVNFAAGTLVLNDVASCVTSSPKWGAQAITDAFTALKAFNALPRAVIVLGDISDTTHLQAITTAILDYETSVNRFSRVICQARDYYAQAVFQGGEARYANLTGQTVTIAASGETYTRSAGSFLVDGFQVGDEVTWAGFSNSANNGPQVITTLAGTVMTCSGSTLVNESTVANTTCSTVGDGEAITVAASGKTYTRSGTLASFITEGFKVGQTVIFSGFSNTANNGPHVLTTVTAGALTAAEVLVDEATKYQIKATANETDSNWRASIESIVGASPSSLIVSHKTLIAGGRARRKSNVDGFFKRRPASWPLLIRWMQKDVKTAPGRVEDQGLAGWTITKSDGTHEDHDERVDGGLLSMRIACLRTFAEIGINGVYVALAVTLDNDDAPMSRLQVGGVADVGSNIVQSETTKKLQSNLELKTDGTIQPYEAIRIQEGVLAELKKNLLATNLGGTDPGPRASDVTFTLDTTVDLSQAGAKQPTVARIEPLGNLEQIENRIIVSKPAS